ncbi:alpha-glucosidase [Vararia minispora EC-137]|uniref:Alpha-glucosidase n=1 Tax=Vararia minispora EC-137 TaxID=1314806 RepID=A0ACB8Q7C0_9AGAM|nr:alpha-glucosidase [Vararia minispora EC-137]
MRSATRVTALLAAFAGVTLAADVDPAVLDACPGYEATNVQTSNGILNADLRLVGTACNVFGNDTETLKLEVTYETATRIHVKITDPNTTRYEVPEEVFPRPASNNTVDASAAQIQFNFTESPFSFNIFRTSTGEVLFSTASHPLIFEPQYLRLKTSLPANANIYGLGEHTNSFRLDPTNTTRTLWSRDAYGVPADTNLYGNHPIYFEHRPTGTHAVFLLNSNGMDIKLNGTADGGSLEYNIIGGIFDFYFLAGSESNPVEVARQYAEVAGTPAEVPYWSLGLHQCRYGYRNYVDVADVITNYSLANIPLETMWTDIDYMYERRVFTLDPEYFPLARMREIIDYLHSHDQKYVVMTDPAVAYTPNDTDSAYHRGVKMDVFLKNPNGSYALAVVWPGVTVYPDWFHPNISEYWNNEFAAFYSAESGLNIDGAWIDMNEPSSFCDYPCTDPFGQAVLQGLPPARPAPPPSPDVPLFGNPTNSTTVSLHKRDLAVPSHEGESLLEPPYAIDNAAGLIPSRTAYTDTVHANGLVEYDTHNIYGTMMSEKTHDAMLARRPGLRTLVITRSTFAGAGRKVGKWLGDNMSGWEWYRNSIAGIMGFASIYQVPMVGADVCGFGGNTTETLCARWATLGAFYPFMRNHNGDTSISQEFYLWDTVAEAARNALSIRYRLLDYIYTAFHQASLDGTPVLNPLWFIYPNDTETYPIDLQFFFGPSLLVSPVTEENSTSVTIYLPADRFYDFSTLAPVNSTGEVTLQNVAFTDIPLHIRGGAVLPLRVNGTMTTTELRGTDFELVVAPDASGIASGALYFDDGVSVTQNATTEATMAFASGTLTVAGDFGLDMQVDVARVLVLGVAQAPRSASVDGQNTTFTYNAATQVVSVAVGIPFNKGFEVAIA